MCYIFVKGSIFEIKVKIHSVKIVSQLKIPIVWVFVFEVLVFNVIVFEVLMFEVIVFEVLVLEVLVFEVLVFEVLVFEVLGHSLIDEAALYNCFRLKMMEKPILSCTFLMHAFQEMNLISRLNKNLFYIHCLKKQTFKIRLKTNAHSFI